MTKNQLYTYDEMLEELPTTKHLLLGNGFSIACDPVFSYNNIYSFAAQHGLSERVQKLFAHFGTTNFELVARALSDTIFVGEAYDLLGQAEAEELLAGIEQIKAALVASIAATHLASPDAISQAARDSCVTFLKPYKNVFTTNYDLLLYWTCMQGMSDASLTFQDGFRSSVDDPAASYVVFSDHLGSKQGMFYLHGALHLFEEAGETKKHCWNRSGVTLTTSVVEALKLNRFPLFVAEGDAIKKLESIQRSGYLSYCYQKLQRLPSPLVVCGSALGESDEHILKAIADGEFTKVYLGVFRGYDSPAANHMDIISSKLLARRALNRTSSPLEVAFYDVRTAPIWKSPHVRKPVTAARMQTTQSRDRNAG